MKHTLVFIMAIVAAGAFAGTSSGENTGSSPRSGALHVTKECSEYHGMAGEFCTITSSNIPAIKPGMRVVYSSAAAFPSLNSDLVLDGPGNNNASGHVALNLRTLSGVVTLSGGTGRFSKLQARVDVTYDPADGLWHWDGTYAFSRSDGDD
jgi:hypothetical protein